MLSWDRGERPWVDLIPMCHHRPVGIAIDISMSPQYWVQESSVINVMLWSLEADQPSKHWWQHLLRLSQK